MREERKGWLLFYEYKVSIFHDTNVEMDDEDCCTTL